MHNHGSSLKNIFKALLINFIFVILEVIGGFFAGSIAIVANAIHDLGDSLTIFLAWLLERSAQSGPNARYSYGFNRLSLLSSLVVSGVLMTGSAIVAWHCVMNFETPTNPQWKIMLPIALLGIGFNGWAYWTLHQGHTHNERAISLHMLEDLLGWCATALVAIALHFVPQLTWLDPLLALAIALFTFLNATKNITDTARLFLQANPKNFNETAYINMVEKLNGVSSAHDVHAWSLDGKNHVISLHIQVDPSLDQKDLQKIKNECRALLKSQGHFHCTIETEPDDSKCNDRCDL